MEMDFLTLMENETGWSRELLYQLVDNVKDYAIFVADLDGKIITWNIGSEKLFGYKAHEAIGQNCRILFTKEDQANNIPEEERRTAREKGCAEDERWHLRQDGSLFYASGVQTPLYDDTGSLTGFAKIARDLTERVKFQAELQESKDNLEIKVRERTEKLNESNEYLRMEVAERIISEQLRVTLLRKIVRTQEEERKRIAREIHDHIGQQITGLQLKLHALLEQNKEETESFDQIAALKSIVNQIDSDVDFLAWELRPSVLDDLGLTAAIKNYVNEWSAHFGIPAEFHNIGLDGKRLMPEIEINLYRISQEALNNTCKYAKANHVSVLLEKRDESLILIIEDNGDGFDLTKKAVLTGADRGMGLLGMKERAELIGGSFEIETSAGNGTTIFVRVPAKFDDPKI